MKNTLSRFMFSLIILMSFNQVALSNVYNKPFISAGIGLGHIYLKQSESGDSAKSTNLIPWQAMIGYYYQLGQIAIGPTLDYAYGPEEKFTMQSESFKYRDRSITGLANITYQTRWLLMGFSAGISVLSQKTSGSYAPSLQAIQSRLHPVIGLTLGAAISNNLSLTMNSRYYLGTKPNQLSTSTTKSGLNQVAPVMLFTGNMTYYFTI